jgi:hypothetical protein
MAEEGKGIALAILGIVAVIAVVGLVLLFTGATGKFAGGGTMDPKLYTRQSNALVADVEDPYYGFEYETYAGESLNRQGTGKYTSAGGAWDPGNVHGESPYDASGEPGIYAPDPYMQYGYAYSVQESEDRAPRSIASDDNSPCGFCPKGSFCQLDTRRVPSNAESVSGYPGCWVIPVTGV